MRADLLARTRELLVRSGYYLSQEAALRPLSFDLLARRDNNLLVVKVLTNIDGLNEAICQELRVLARFLDAAPLVVGERSSSRDLEPGAVYLRYGVRIVHPETLEDYLVDGVEPLVYAAPGGFYVNIDGQRLRELRESRGLSLGEMASAAGVSRRAIGMYEQGMGAMVDVAARLEDFLHEPLVVPMRPFAPPDAHEPAPTPATIEPPSDPLEAFVYEAMQRFGFDLAPTAKSPFSAIGRGGHIHERRIILTSFANQRPDAAKRAAATANLCDVAETYGAIFTLKQTTRVAVEGTPVVSRDELKRFDDPEALLELLRERKGQRR